ncbi:MAG: zf-HC2 domain-containing protein [Actinomycetes bacterium]
MSSNRAGWHAVEADLSAYVTGAASPVLDASLDAHLARCQDCRRSIARLVDGADTERRWSRVADVVDRPSGWLRDRLGILGGHELTRVALAAPSLRWGWGVSLGIVLALPLASVLVFGAGPQALAVLLAVAPLAPAAAVAIAYRSGADPAGEMALATPAAGLRLVAMRAVVVAAAAVPPGLAVGWLTGVPTHLAVAWLLPGLALAALVLLAGTTRLDPLVAAAVLGGAWALAVAGPAPVRGLAAQHVIDAVAGPTVQLAALVVLSVSLLLSVARRDALAYRRTA